MTVIETARPAIGMRRAGRRSREQRFRLLRYFSIASLIGVVLVLAGLLLFYRHLATEALMEHQAQMNVAITKTFANTIWPKYAGFLSEAHQLSAHALADHSGTAELRAD